MRIETIKKNMDSDKNIKEISFASSFRVIYEEVMHRIFNGSLPIHKYTKLKVGVLFSFFLLTFLLMSSCDYNRRTTGWQYFDDMAQSEAYESYTPNSNFEDGKTMQPPVEGTIPRGMVPYAFEKTDEDRALAATVLVNTLEATPSNVKRGERMYGIYCMNCHGEKGDGLGNLYVDKKYPYPPASLLSEKMLTNPESEIYHVITVGHGIMSEHGSMIQPDDRWKIAMYIKEELQK